MSDLAIFMICVATVLVAWLAVAAFGLYLVYRDCGGSGKGCHNCRTKRPD